MRTIIMQQTLTEVCREIARLVVQEMTDGDYRSRHCIVITQEGQVELAYRDDLHEAVMVIADLTNASKADFGDWDDADPEGMQEALSDMYQAEWLRDACIYSAIDEGGVELKWPNGTFLC